MDEFCSWQGNDPWVCKKCSRINAMPTESSLDCKRCEKSNYCAFHRGWDRNPVNNKCCYKCGCDKRYSVKEIGTPGEIWRKEREEYKSAMIFDKPAEIPEYAQHLQSDAERFLFKQAKRGVQSCIDTKAYNTDFEDPKDLMYQLKHLNKNCDIPRAVKRKGNLEVLDEILWNACMHHDWRHCGGSPGQMMSAMEEIDQCLQDHKECFVERAQEIEEIVKDPNTKQIRGSKRNKYFINAEKRYCSCPAFQYGSSDCKHLLKLRGEQDEG